MFILFGRVFDGQAWVLNLYSAGGTFVASFELLKKKTYQKVKQSVQLARKMCCGILFVRNITLFAEFVFDSDQSNLNVHSIMFHHIKFVHNQKECKGASWYAVII